MARYMRTDLGPNNARLRPPAVVGDGIYYRGIQVYRTQEPRKNERRRRVESKLRPPTVVLAAQVFSGPSTAYRVSVQNRQQRRGQRRDVRAFLRPPVVLQTNLRTKSKLFLRQGRGTPKSFLRPPTVVLSTAVFYGPALHLVRIRPRRTLWRLAPPAAVGAGIAWHGPGVYLTRPKQPSPIHSRLPQFVPLAAAQIYYGPAVHITRGRAGKPKSRLSPPTILQTNLRTQVTLVRIRPRRTFSVLRPPTDTIGLEDQGRLATHLTYSRRGRPRSFLRTPTDTIGLEDQGSVQTTLAPQQRGRAKSRLSPPAVVTVVAAFYGPAVHLTRIRPPKVHPTYIYPIVVLQTQAFGYLAAQLVVRPRPKTLSRLSAPAVITQVAQIYYGPAVHLARVRRPVAKSALRPPAILATSGPSQYWLAYSRRGAPHSFLRPPADTIGLEDQGKVSVHLAPQRRGQPKSRLEPPTVVAQPPAYQQVLPPALAYSRRGTPKSRLQPPTVVFPFFARPTDVTLAPQRRGRPTSHLSPPVVVFLAVEIYGPVVVLARIKPPPTIAFLRPPTDVIDLADQGQVRTHLAYSLRKRGVARLRPPAVVAQPAVFYGPSVHLVRIKPQPTTSFLRPFSERAFEISLGPELHLSYSRRGRPVYRLQPPAVVGQVVFYGPSTALAPSFRGIPKSRLLPPTVVDQPPAFLPPERFSFAPQSRGVPKSRLLPPAVVGAGKVNPGLRRYLVARQTPLLLLHRKYTSRLRPPTVIVTPYFTGPVTSLAPQTRGKPKSHLFPPTVLAVAGTLAITLAPQRRGRPKSFLRPPVVVRTAVEIYGPAVELTYSRRGRPKSELIPPVVVGVRPFRGILTHLAYSRRGQPKSRLTFIAGRVVYPGPRFTLTYSLRGRPKSVLHPASVIGAGIAFYGPQVHLVRIRPPKVIHALRLTLVAFRRPQGDVCGFDIAASFVCEIQLPGSQVSGSDSAVHGVSGTSRAGSRVTGSESAGGSVSGSDRKAT